MSETFELLLPTKDSLFHALARTGNYSNYLTDTSTTRCEIISDIKSDLIAQLDLPEDPMDKENKRTVYDGLARDMKIGKDKLINEIKKGDVSNMSGETLIYIGNALQIQIKYKNKLYGNGGYCVHIKEIDSKFYLIGLINKRSEISFRLLTE